MSAAFLHTRILLLSRRSDPLANWCHPSWFARRCSGESPNKFQNSMKFQWCLDMISMISTRHLSYIDVISGPVSSLEIFILFHPHFCFRWNSWREPKSSAFWKRKDWPPKSPRICITWLRRPSPSESIWRETGRWESETLACFQRKRASISTCLNR